MYIILFEFQSSWRMEVFSSSENRNSQEVGRLTGNLHQRHRYFLEQHIIAEFEAPRTSRNKFHDWKKRQ